MFLFLYCRCHPPWLGASFFLAFCFLFLFLTSSFFPFSFQIKEVLKSGEKCQGGQCHKVNSDRVWGWVCTGHGKDKKCKMMRDSRKLMNRANTLRNMAGVLPGAGFSKAGHYINTQSETIKLKNKHRVKQWQAFKKSAGSVFFPSGGRPFCLPFFLLLPHLFSVYLLLVSLLSLPSAASGVCTSASSAMAIPGARRAATHAGRRLIP